jgi:hypothetical protein
MAMRNCLAVGAAIIKQVGYLHYTAEVGDTFTICVILLHVNIEFT